MDRQRYAFQRVTALTAVAVGQPGQRTFYVAVGEGGSWVRVWLEKEELQSLSVAIDELLDTIVQKGHRSPLKDTDATPEILHEPPQAPAADFKSSRLAIGYEQSRDRIGLFVYGPEASGDSPTVVCWITRPQAHTLGKKIDAVCASGRPLCILCNNPVDPEGHVCPRSNGHRQRDL